MSQGVACNCADKKARKWAVLQRCGNASAFNGYRWQFSAYSAVTCLACGRVWRTKAAYVRDLPDISGLKKENKHV